MLQWIQEKLGITQPAVQALLPVEQAATAAPAPETFNAANDSAPPVASDEPARDWVTEANTILAQVLKKLPVRRYGVHGSAEALPVESVHIGALKPSEGSMVVALGRATDEQAMLTLQLKENVGNYNSDALNHAVHAVLGSIPVLSGKFKFAKDVSSSAVNHGDVWAKLKAELAKSNHFSETELNSFGEYFEGSKFYSAGDTDWGQIDVNHADGKVQVALRPQALKEDKS